MKILRQGDVLLVQVSAVPENAIAQPSRQDGKVILALGKATGHHHRIETRPHAPSARLWDAGDERFLQVMEAAALRHEEHATVALPPGVYRVAIQQEYYPQELRNVAD